MYRVCWNNKYLFIYLFIYLLQNKYEITVNPQSSQWFSTREKPNSNPRQLPKHAAVICVINEPPQLRCIIPTPLMFQLTFTCHFFRKLAWIGSTVNTVGIGLIHCRKVYCRSTWVEGSGWSAWRPGTVGPPCPACPPPCGWPSILAAALKAGCPALVSRRNLPNRQSFKRYAPPLSRKSI